MCGIIGIYDPSAAPRDSDMAAAIASLIHRGPDSQDTWRAPSGQATLGHTLMSITQLGGGNQPISNADGSCAITVNGEFYDYEPTWQELEAQGYRFKTRSDSELPLHLYDRYGPAFLERLRGEFVFILWDDNNRRLMAARDRFGICPLYYAQHEGRLYLASEIKALFAAGVPAIWDEEAVFLQHHGATLPGHTLFKGIRQLEPGHMMIASASGITLRRYWDMDFARETGEADTSPETVDAAITRTRDLYLEAVRLRIPSSGAKYGCYLSGGLDSSAVLGAVTHFAGQNIPTFTIGFDDDPQFDESPAARATAKALGADLHELRITSSDLAEHFMATVFHAEGMLGNGGSVAKFLLSRLAHDTGCRAIITGEGADEIFGGYEELFPAPTEMITDHPDMSLVKAAMGGTVPVWMAFGIKNAEKLRSFLAAEFLQRFQAMSPTRALMAHLDIEGGVRDRAPIDASMYVWQKTVLANFLLRTLGDGVERAHSIEGRLPLLDHKLADYVASLPADLRIRPGTSKFLLREAVRPFVPEAVFNTPKAPFLAPPTVGDHLSPFLSRLVEIIGDSDPAALPFFDRNHVIATARSIPGLPPRDRISAERQIIRIASLFALQTHFTPDLETRS